MTADRRIARLLLALVAICFGAFALVFVRRLNNNVMGDMEFTGWTGPFAARLAAGERPYLDFVLPLPPGSFMLLAAIQKLMGQELLLQELGLIATSQLLMGLLAYAIAARLTTRLNAVLAAACTLVMVVQMPKECAYDHTAQLCTWSSLALGVRALLASGPARLRWFLATGAVAALTFAFKQSTATGICGGWVMAFGYLSLARRGSRAGALLETLGRDARAWASGAALGLACCALSVLASGATLGAYFQAVFVDGPELKGGSWVLLGNLAGYVFLAETYPSGLALTAVLLGIGMRVVRLEGAFQLGDEPLERPSFTRTSALAVAAAVILVFGTALGLLVFQVRALPQLVIATALELREIPMFGLALGCAFFVGQLVRPAELGPDTVARGHALNALFVVAVASSLLHGLSFVNFYPFYNNDALIPFAFVYLFAAVDRSRLRWLKPLIVVLVLSSLFGLKLNRALSADIPVKTGHWAGLYVNYRGKELLDAAARVRALAGPDETVLVLPEDAQLVSLIGRPRPKLKGAIVFVDQYPDRLTDADLAELERAPPKVIVIHPRQRAQWQRLYSTWAKDSGAERITLHVLDQKLERYRRDSSFRSIYFWDQGQIDVYVRGDSTGREP